VRSIGACYSYISEEKPVPAGLNERILQATLGTITPQEIRAPWTSRLASRLRLWLDPIVSPQLATVATMLLIAVLVLTSTVSADGSIGGVYSVSLQLAQQTGGVSRNGLKELVGGSSSQAPEQKTNGDHKPQSKSDGRQQPVGDNKR
jgi:hypothetical protein